ncbi:type IX secretion system outer membrane channel protein PorV [Flavobacterium sp. TSSA_36]|uniref:type IX secretion system outer membrane channel protein PorV n=1 Tax=Flavobacterium sp. TSSA_36 TaxID=3447669 RepID=UPI003F3732A0
MKNIIIVFLFLFAVGNVEAQTQSNRNVTGVPFLRIASDARAAGMGDTGVATATDVFSQQWNAAKYPFSEDKFGVGISYTPYLTSLTNDMALVSANFFNKINDRSTFGVGLRYFGMGEVVFRSNENDPGRVVNPNELALEGSYALKLSNSFAMAVSGRYIRSDLKLQEQFDNAKVASSFAVDLGGFYQSNEFSLKGIQSRWRAGFNLSNLGSKLNYSDANNNESVLPSNLAVGTGIDFIFDTASTLGATLEFNKLLTKGAKGITTGIGIEYVYQNVFALRTGYFNDVDTMYAVNYFTFGGGFTIKKLKIDLSYLASTSKHSSPLDNTLRFSLSFNIGDYVEPVMQ